MKFKLFSCLVLFVFPLFVCAQTAVTVLFTPIKYIDFPDGDIFTEATAVRDKRHLWTVYSDRNDNIVYKKPDNTAAAVSTVNFLDKFYATAETEFFLELYKWEEGIRLAGAIQANQLNPQKAKRIGWVKKDNLLLWGRCLQNKTTHFSEKAFFAVTEKNWNKTIGAPQEDLIKFYRSPGLQNNNDKGTINFQLLYVYKRIGNSVLLGKTYKSDPFRIERDILGWMDESLLQKWGNRLFLEPNWDAEAVNLRKTEGIKTSLFANKKEALNWKEGKKNEGAPIWDDDPFENHWPGSKFRFPVLDTDGDLVYTGFFAPFTNESNSKITHLRDPERHIPSPKKLFKNDSA